MANLQELIPDAALVLSMSAAELAPVLLKFGRDHVQNGMFWPPTITQPGFLPNSHRYPYDKQNRIDVRVAETWEWLRNQGFIAPAPGINGSNGWMMLTSKGEEAARGNFDELRAAVEFPKSLLHPSIADQVWVLLARDELDTAVSVAFKAVEVAVRAAASLPSSDFGTRLMRKAFDKTAGPLADMTLHETEREGMALMFEGAMGFVRNAHVHRPTDITRQEAQDRLLLASYLLRIADARRTS